MQVKSSIHDPVPQAGLSVGKLRQRTNNRYGLADEADLSDDSACQEYAPSLPTTLPSILQLDPSVSKYSSIAFCGLIILLLLV